MLNNKCLVPSIMCILIPSLHSSFPVFPKIFPLRSYTHFQMHRGSTTNIMFPISYIIDWFIVDKGRCINNWSGSNFFSVSFFPSLSYAPSTLYNRIWFRFCIHACLGTKLIFIVSTQMFPVHIRNLKSFFCNTFLVRNKLKLFPILLVAKMGCC